MDAYGNYIRQITEARLGDLRREAAERALSLDARRARPTLAARAFARLARRGGRGMEAAPVAPIALPTRPADGELRRSA